MSLFPTIALIGEYYYIMVSLDRMVRVDEREAKRIRDYLCALLESPTVEEIAAIGG